MIHFLIRTYRRFRYMRYGWFGNYPSWAAVSKEAGGYDARGILQKILNGARKVKNGEAVWERDGVLLTEIEYSWPLLTHLLWVAEKKQGRLSVLDFGGGLGTAWFQNRAYLDQDKTLWSVVEQDAFVKVGREEIAEGALQFYPDIDNAIASRGQHDLLLLGCVLPYLEKPYDFLAEALQKGIPYIIIENTYFNHEAGDRLTLQKVPPFYYEASYPAWFLDYDKVKTLLLARYEPVAEYSNDTFLYLYGRKINYRGIVLRLRD